MFQKRPGQHNEDETAGMAETARSAADAGTRGGPAEPGDERLSVFWRVFGGTILSIAALVGITVFNNVSSGIADLRNELNREREARAELVKKDEFNARTTNQYERIRSFDGLKAELEGLRERANANAAAADGLKKDSAAALDAAKKELTALADSFKKDAAALEILRERVVGLEGVKKDVAGIDLLKERLAAATIEVKAAREELAKVSQEVERNKASDLERKAFRDAQHKQVDEAIKELQKDVQLCREKLARFEGAQPAGAGPRGLFPFDPPPSPPAKPVPPAESKGAGDPAGAGAGKPAEPGTPPGAAKPGPGGE